MKETYYINGWKESKSYFLSFGFSHNEIEQMKKGESIFRDGNEYRIEVKE